MKTIDNIKLKLYDLQLVKKRQFSYLSFKRNNLDATYLNIKQK